MLRSCLVSRRRVGNEAREGMLDRCETEPVGLPDCGKELGFPAKRPRRSTYCSSPVDCEQLASQNARCSVSGDLEWRLGAETEFEQQTIGQCPLRQVMGHTCLGVCRNETVPHQESITYRPCITRKLLILRSRNSISDRLPSGWLQSTQRVLRPFLLSKVIRK
jgi:hypothetical protein